MNINAIDGGFFLSQGNPWIVAIVSSQFLLSWAPWASKAIRSYVERSCTAATSLSSESTRTMGISVASDVILTLFSSRCKFSDMLEFMIGNDDCTGT